MVIVEYAYIKNVLNAWEIVFKTVFTVFKREGISSETTATMEEFMGSEE